MIQKEHLMAAHAVDNPKDLRASRIVELHVLRGFAILLVLGTHLPAYALWARVGRLGWICSSSSAAFSYRIWCSANVRIRLRSCSSGARRTRGHEPANKVGKQS